MDCGAKSVREVSLVGDLGRHGREHRVAGAASVKIITHAPTVARKRYGWAPIGCQIMPVGRQPLAELGQAAGASARTLSRLFRNELGMTFYEWRTQLRIYHALILLADGHDTAHVAHACGWANPSSFIAAFTGIIGTTPGRYRISHRLRTTP